MFAACKVAVGNNWLQAKSAVTINQSPVIICLVEIRVPRSLLTHAATMILIWSVAEIRRGLIVLSCSLSPRKDLKVPATVGKSTIGQTIERAEMAPNRGSIMHEISSMALPLFFATVLISLVGLTDSFVAGRLGAVQQAAVGLASQGTFILFIVSMALSTGSTALVSRFWGAQDYANATVSSRYILIGASLLGGVVALIGTVGAEQILHLMGAKAEVIEAGSTFMHVFMLGALPLTILWAMNALFRAMGQAQLSLFTWFVAASVAISSDLMLVLGPPKMGLLGVAVSWVSALMLGVIASLFFLSRSPLGGALKPARLSLTELRYWLWRTLRIGLPASAQDGGYMLIRIYFFGLFSLMPYATSCQAAYSIGLRVENLIAIMPVIALCLGVTALVGRIWAQEIRSELSALVGWRHYAASSLLLFSVVQYVSFPINLLAS